MILADKITKLRKKNGWSQEELAEKMNVSRQAVSKWESAQNIPDLGRILQLGELFGVTIDYLLKDEIEEEEFTNIELNSGIKRVSIEEAVKYIEYRKWASYRIAIGTFLCIISPIALFILTGISEISTFSISVETATLYGLTILFLFIIIAVSIFLHCGFKNEPYKYLDEIVPFELEYGVKGMVLEKQKELQPTYARYNIIATCICIVSPLPLIYSSFTYNEFFVLIMLGVTITLAGIGVFLFIVNGVQMASMQKLLKEGEYSLKEKEKSRFKSVFSLTYWFVITSIYLILSFSTNAWESSWLVFAVGGILFAPIISIFNLFIDNRLTKQ